MRLKFLHGLDDDMREQALKDFWQENKKIIIGGFAVLFLSYGGGQFYKYYSAAKMDAQALAYHQASQLDTPEVYKDYAEEAPAGFKALALFKAANSQIQADELAAAADTFATIAQDSKLPPLWRDLAAARQGELLLTLDPDKARTVFSTLTKQDSPYARTGYELLAIEAQNRGAYGEAAAYYSRLLEMPDLLAGMREAIQQRLTYLEGKGYITATGQKVEETN